MKNKKKRKGGVAKENDSEAGESPNKAGRTAMQRNYVFSHRIREDHNCAIFSLNFNHCRCKYKNLFATTGSNRVTVYQLFPDGVTDVMQVYVDQNKDEEFYSTAWSEDPQTGVPMLAVGGSKGIVRVLNCKSASVARVFTGHGNSINDLKFHPINGNLLLSASKDESCRLWHVANNICIAIFCGDNGHKGEVLSVDFHLDGKRFASAGMDNAVKIWNLETM